MNDFSAKLDKNRVLVTNCTFPACLFSGQVTLFKISNHERTRTYLIPCIADAERSAGMPGEREPAHINTAIYILGKRLLHHI